MPVSPNRHKKNGRRSGRPLFRVLKTRVFPLLFRKKWKPVSDPDGYETIIIAGCVIAVVPQAEIPMSLGNIPNGKADGPMVGNPGAEFLGARKGPYGYIIVLTGETERAKIVAVNKDLLNRLIAWKSYFKAPGGMH